MVMVLGLTHGSQPSLIVIALYSCISCLRSERNGAAAVVIVIQ